MKAIIMAGGEGTRLRPLTCDCPKPMLNIMGKPMMEYALRLVKRCGIREAGVTLGYLPQAVTEYFGSGAEFGMDMRYYIEKTPLGTAGSVRAAKDFLDGRFIVLSGDGICDFDLSKAIEFHEKRRAKATMILKKHPDPLEYGMVVLNDDLTVRSFHEKPGRCEVYSNLINTGIYILEPELLERIPEGRPCDFGRDFFPGMLAGGEKIYGYAADGYWCDVGDVGAYLKVHRDAMDGKIGIIGGENCFISPDALIEPDAIIESPCAIAAYAHICAGARIGAYSCIGEGAVVESGAGVKRSIVMKNAKVCESAQLRGCIVGQNAVVESGAQLFEESVAGAFSRIGEGALLVQGVKLWPRKEISAGERPQENIVWGAKGGQRFISGCLQADEPAQAARFARGLISEMKADEIIIGHAASGMADAMARAAVAGAMAQGAQVYDAGTCSLPQLRYAQKSIRAGSAAFIDENGIMPLNTFGAMMDEKRRRAMLRTIERQDYSGAFSVVTRPVKALGDCETAYIADTAVLFCADAVCAPGVLLACENRHILDLACRIFERAGLSVRTETNIEAAHPDEGEILAEISSNGEKCFISDQDNAMDEVQRELMCAWTLLKKGERRLLLPLNATRTIDILCERENAHAVYIPGEISAWCAAAAEKAPRQFLLEKDGIVCALSFISCLVKQGLSLRQWRESMPAAFRSFRKVRMDASQTGAALHSLFESHPDAQFGGGMRLAGENGWAWISPDDVQPEMCVMAEAAKHETADELCFFYADALERLIKQPND